MGNLAVEKIAELKSIGSDSPLRGENFSVSSTKEYQERIKFSALPYSSNIIPMRDTESSQIEDKKGKIKRRRTTNNETSAKKINESIYANAGREISS